MDLTRIVKSAAGAMAMATMAAGAIPGASALEPNPAQSSPVQAVTGTVQQITLTMGKGELFQTSAPYAKVSVTDEKIVEVTPQSDRELVVNPRGVGSTNVFVLDDKNRLVARLDINVVSNLPRLQQIRQEQSGEDQGRVRVYNRIYDKSGVPNRPATYQCSDRNCEIVSEAPITAQAPAPAPAEAPAPAGAPPDNANPQ